MATFVALDVSLEKTATCIMLADGSVSAEVTAASDPEAIAVELARQKAVGADALVGLEAGPLSEWIARGLADVGASVTLMETWRLRWTSRGFWRLAAERSGDGRSMDDVKGRPFEGRIILWAVRWCCKYGVSCRELEEMLQERGVVVDHTTIYRWTQRYAPEIERRLRWYWRRPRSTSWRGDETYVKVRGRWAYLYRTIDKRGDTIDFHLSPTRNSKAAKRLPRARRCVG